MARSLKRKTITETIRCRKCQFPKKVDDYYKCVDEELDSNGKLSICKQCCRELFDKQMVFHGNMEKAFLSICRRLNIAYDQIAIEKTHEKMEELKGAGKSLDVLFGTYLQFIHVGKSLETVLTFKEPDSPIKISEEHIIGTNINITDMEKKWGKGFSIEEYVFLNEEYDSWTEDRKTLTRPDETLLEEIAHQKLKVRKARMAGDPTDDLVKQLQALLKSANEQLKANKDQEEEGLDTISSIIKIMETSYPAEFYKDKSLYADFDYDVADYYDKHVTRAIKNFASGTRDFDFDLENEKEENDDDISLENINFENVGKDEG